MQDTKFFDKDYERYKDWDMSDAKPVDEVPALKRLQEARNKHQKLSKHSQTLPNVFDDDVLNLIQLHADNQHDVQRMNDMLRILFS